jgi:hypothetical protein
MVRDEMERSRRPFRHIINQAIRLGLRAGGVPTSQQPFQTRPHAFRFRPGVDLDKLGQVADELEAETFRRRYHAQA